MPPDDDWTDESQILDEVRQFFCAHPDPECIPLFLNVFGVGSGYGVYQQIELAIVQYEPSLVLPHLIAALQSHSESVAYWCAQIAEHFPDPSLIDPLISLTKHQNEDIKAAAITAIGGIQDPRVLENLNELLLEDDLDEDMRELVQDGIENQPCCRS